MKGLHRIPLKVLKFRLFWTDTQNRSFSIRAILPGQNDFVCVRRRSKCYKTRERYSNLVSHSRVWIIIAPLWFTHIAGSRLDWLLAAILNRLWTLTSLPIQRRPKRSCHSLRVLNSAIQVKFWNPVTNNELAIHGGNLGGMKQLVRSWVWWSTMAVMAFIVAQPELGRLGANAYAWRAVAVYRT